MPVIKDNISDIRKKRSEPVAIAIGGSIFNPMILNQRFLVKLVEKLIELSKTRNLFVVVGGGGPARQNIEAARAAFVDNEALLDQIGIQATRLNAQTLASVLHSAGSNVNLTMPQTVKGALELANQHEIVVMGGTTPGHSTDFVAAELANLGDCERLVVATNVDGVHKTDPRKDPDSKHLPKLTFRELMDIIGAPDWVSAGSPGVLDGPSVRLITQHTIPTNVVHGHNLDNLVLATNGEQFIGTCISNEKTVIV